MHEWSAAGATTACAIAGYSQREIKPGRASPGQSATGVGASRFDNASETFGIVNRDLGQHLAVQLHVRLGQPLDQAAVGDAVCFAGGRDANDPELTIGTLLVLAMDIGHAHRAIHRLRRLAKKLTAGPAKALGQFKAAFAALAGCGCVGCSWHD